MKKLSKQHYIINTKKLSRLKYVFLNNDYDRDNYKYEYKRIIDFY